MASTFRASPWVTYQPSDASQVHEPFHQPQDPAGTTMIMDMAMDVDMEAPQISTLREEETPPPTGKKQASPRKPKAPKPKATEQRIQPRPEVRKVKPAGEDDLEDQGEDEEDQLIDDDAPSSAALPASARTPDSTPKKKPAPKRKAKKEKPVSDGSNDLKKVAKEKLSSQPSNAGTPESSSQILVEGSLSQPEPVMLKLSAAAKKKQAASVRKTASTPRGKGKGAKSKAALAPHLVEDAMSEAGYTGTAPSSPGTALMDLHDDAGTPEPDNTTIAPSSPPVPASAALAPDESAAAPSLENVAIPQYPLPTKPFPVQAPVKITSGFAPPIPLDKSSKKVRHWRPANREIRGIAGGRWFAKTWVGEKDSEYANYIDDKAGNASVAGGSISAARLSAAVLGTGKGSGKGRGSKGASAVASTVPSRAGSAGPEPSASVARPMTKMRILQLAPSDNGDSDMAPPDS